MPSNSNKESGDKILRITFAGGTGSVTGANFLVEGGGVRFLIDCGLEQGTKQADENNWSPFSYDVSNVDVLFISHAHIDHVGRIPKLVYDGFKGKIYSTIPTKEISELMLEDTAHILSKGNNEMLKSVYSEANLKKALDSWEVVDYHQDISVGPDMIFRYRDAGHVLGSGMLELIYNNKKIVFTIHVFY